uniref:Uncharacterized protein n=1 Tax=Sphaerodactylus townsendi TaxID=933632 RepID=A0ACB8FIV0_9SAUR
MDRAPPEKHITTCQHVDCKPVMRMVTEEIGLSTIHRTTRELLERFLDHYLEEPPPVDYWQSTGAQPKATAQDAPLQESLDFELPESGAVAALPAVEEEEGLIDLRRGSRLRLSFAEGLGDGEPEEPPDPPGATSSRHEDLGLPRGDPDPSLLHAQHEALEKAKREWQQACEALIEDRLQQRIRFQEELEWEKKALHLQFQQDREKQERKFLQAAEQSKQDLLRQRQSLKALRVQGDVDSAVQRAERLQLQREREALDRQRNVSFFPYPYS